VAAREGVEAVVIPEEIWKRYVGVEEVELVSVIQVTDKLVEESALGLTVGLSFTMSLSFAVSLRYTRLCVFDCLLGRMTLILLGRRSRVRRRIREKNVLLLGL
jgi:hypothetical protein